MLMRPLLGLKPGGDPPGEPPVESDLGLKTGTRPHPLEEQQAESDLGLKPGTRPSWGAAGRGLDHCSG
nr:hypothetical protein Itr_chr05CG22620 [Ipomoea trifida]